MRQKRHERENNKRKWVNICKNINKKVEKITKEVIDFNKIINYQSDQVIDMEKHLT